MDLKPTYYSRNRILERFRENPLQNQTGHPHYKVMNACLFAYGVPFMRYDTETGRYVIALDISIPRAAGQSFRRDAARYFPFAVRLPHIHATWYETQQYYDAPENRERYNFDNYRKDAENYYTGRPHKEEVIALQKTLDAIETRTLARQEPAPDMPSAELLLYEYFSLPSRDQHYAFGCLRSPYGTDELRYKGVVLAKPKGRHMLVVPPITMRGPKTQQTLDYIYDHFPENGKIVPCIPPPEDEAGHLDGIGGAMRLIAQHLEHATQRTKRAERLARYYAILLRSTRKPAYTPTPAQEKALRRFGAFLVTNSDPKKQM